MCKQAKKALNSSMLSVSNKHDTTDEQLSVTHGGYILKSKEELKKDIHLSVVFGPCMSLKIKSWPTHKFWFIIFFFDKRNR